MTSVQDERLAREIGPLVDDVLGKPLGVEEDSLEYRHDAAPHSPHDRVRSSWPIPENQLTQTAGYIVKQQHMTQAMYDSEERQPIVSLRRQPPRVRARMADRAPRASDGRPVQSTATTSAHLLGKLVSVQAAAAPETVAVETENGERMTFGILDKRSNRLGRALVAMGIEPRQRVALLCCEDHPCDLMVAYVGVQKAGAISVLLPPSADTDQIAEVLHLVKPRLVIACSEGSEALKAAQVPVRVVGDAPDVVWWKALELKHSPDPFQVPAHPDEIAEVLIHPGDDGTWTIEELTHTRVLELVATSEGGAPPAEFWGWSKRRMRPSVEGTLIDIAAAATGLDRS